MQADRYVDRQTDMAITSGKSDSYRLINWSNYRSLWQKYILC